MRTRPYPKRYLFISYKELDRDVTSWCHWDYIFHPYLKGRLQHPSIEREKKKMLCIISPLAVFIPAAPPPFFLNLFLFQLSPSRKIYLKTCVLVGCWTIDGRPIFACIHTTAQKRNGWAGMVYMCVYNRIMLGGGGGKGGRLLCCAY